MNEFPEIDRSDRIALEDIYLLSTASADGLSGEVVEDPPKKNTVSNSVVRRIKKTAVDSTERSSVSSSPVQFKGLSMTPNQRSKKRKSLSSTQPIPRSHMIAARGESTNANRSRSSTMPGFMERSSTDRQKAFEAGIKIAEQRSGKKYVDTPEAKKKRREVNGGAMYKASASVPDSMIQFANEIHEVERITPKEEIFLGEKTQEAIRLQKIFDGLIAKLDREPTDAEWCSASGKINMESLSQTIEEGLEAKNKLVTSNLRMVQGVVNVYIRNGLSGQYNAGDLMQEGIMVRAILCFGILGNFMNE
jgi:DNA-directed RNA polymerase sigma subunit (sigma70/sigma32)